MSDRRSVGCSVTIGHGVCKTDALQEMGGVSTTDVLQGMGGVGTTDALRGMSGVGTKGDQSGMVVSKVAFIGGGGNLGDREGTLRSAIERLRKAPGILKVESSSIFETEPVGVVDQPPFLNLVLAVDTTLSPEGLLRELQRIEQEFGRVRTIRWGPRTLDLDLLLYEGETRATSKLTLPHPRIWERDFVKVPLRELLERDRFSHAPWSEIRRRLQAEPAGQTGVVRFKNGRLTPVLPTPLPSDVVEYLHQLKRHGVELGLDRMRAFAAALENPQDRLRVIHITGTNGKGSVAAMLEAILRRAGWKTGLYTSPHLVRLGERIQVNREPLGSEELGNHVRALREIVDRLPADARPSYFEFMTGLAFLHFVRAACDIAIIEVGMGGRRDATNIVTPELSVITSVGLDHMEFLGRTIEEIATEKAGIIKPRRPVVIGQLPAAAETVMREAAGVSGSQVFCIREAFGSDPTQFPTTNLSGRFQRANAATATVVARQLAAKWNLDDGTIAAGLMNVSWPGRWQSLVVGGRKVVVDASHNAEGAGELDHNLATLVRKTGRKPIVVVGVLGADRARPLLDVIARHTAEIHLVVPRQRRACSCEELERLIPEEFTGRAIRNSVEAVFPSADTSLPGVPVDCPIVVTGSIYLAGEVLARLDPSLGPLEDDLQDF